MMDCAVIIGENKTAGAVVEHMRRPNHQPTLAEVRPMATYTVRNCPQCGKQFQPNASHARHCSPECRFRDIAARFSGYGCWEWPLSRNKVSGYGQFTLRPVPSQIVTTAHRLSFLLFVGPLQPGQCVMHKCDNRACFNPEHLQAGSLTDNNRDMVSKRRAAWQLESFSPASTCLRGHAKKQSPSGRWKCLDCEMLRKREQRVANRGGLKSSGKGRPGVPRREVGQTTTRNRTPQ